MKVEIETTPKLHKIKLRIDGKDYTTILPQQIKRNICNYVQRALIDFEDTEKEISEALPKSISINPTEYCLKCPGYITNCAKYFKVLHGQIEVCENLYYIILQHHILPPEELAKK